MGRGEGGIAAPERTKRQRPLFEPPSRFQNVQALVVQTDAEHEDACRRVREEHEPALREVAMLLRALGDGGSEIVANTLRAKANRLGRRLGLPQRWRVMHMPYRLTGESEPALVFDENGAGDMSIMWASDIADDANQMAGFFASVAQSVPTAV